MPRPIATHHRAAAIVVTVAALIGIVRRTPPPRDRPARLDEPTDPARPAPPPPAPVPTRVPIDLNVSDVAALARLPGIGPVRAARIAAARARGVRFATPHDLLRVPSIGPRTVARVEQYLSTEAANGETDSGVDRPTTRETAARR
jgi:hypothetical protein